MFNEKILKLANLIKESNNIIFLGGAGVSTESNIPDFRSSNGLYYNKFKNFDIEEILSSNFFFNNTEMFYKFYKETFIKKEYSPNRVHFALKELEEYNLKGIVTQNIDDFHNIVKSKNVVELHGNGNMFYCVDCKKEYNKDYILKDNTDIPICDKCNGLIRPDIVLYEEFLDNNKLNIASNLIANADVLIIGGTSLTVEPAASLVNLYRNSKLIIINNQETPYDCVANMIFRENLGDVFNNVLKILNSL